jgi:alpha-L-rhamnosidase
VVCGSDLEVTGTFTCGDERINRLHENIVWGARGNFVDVPTDCPQRDERMGWTGDAQVFAPTACYLFDTAAFFTKWLRDLRDTQTSEGSFCDVAPRVVLGPDGSAGWADAGVIVPWVVSGWFADDRLLAESYPAMRAWVAYVHTHNPGLLWLERRGYDNGDWLNVGAETDKDLLATACFARSARLTARAAEVLGEPEAAALRVLADRITEAFRAAYLLPDGRLKCETQTGYALALRFGLVPQALAAAAVDHLVADIDSHHGLTTGFLGVGHLLPALTEGGRIDVAYRLLLDEGMPSWLHSVVAGATTMWERWDGWTAEAGFQDPAMNSFNHYAFGAVGEWLYRSVAGLDVQGRHVRIAPAPHPALGQVRASHRTPFGPVGCAWELTGAGLEVTVEVPVGMTASVVLPAERAGSTVTHVEPGTHRFTVPAQGRDQTQSEGS